MNRFSPEEKQAGGRSAAAGAKRRKLIWIALMVIFFSWAGYIFFAQSALISDKSQELARKQQSSKQVNDSLNQLKYEVSRLNDNEYIGQLARKWFNIYPKGEVPIRTEQP
ncbi:cell division protein DivIC [Paenibacillus sophorae]|uniref:Cell division protein DivIC n=1 Tax=Paenibacillus sophorae TaxID=1333845 RepID=A0A1H8V5A7_9BACL|nr:septum formation initiator family protein [Paenibacillus sophorae]QWU16345.1 septum formation initiator family protein [Paenibacillus sophorae]SEP10605.1 cell division protein DivIC [Paenibacillus sophorae]